MPGEHWDHSTATPVQTKQLLGSGGTFMHLIAKHSQSTNLFQNKYFNNYICQSIWWQRNLHLVMQLHHLILHNSFMYSFLCPKECWRVFPPLINPVFPLQKIRNCLFLLGIFWKTAWKTSYCSLVARQGMIKCVQQQFGEQDCHIRVSPTRQIVRRLNNCFIKII